MPVVCLADNSHEMSRFLFYKKIDKNDKVQKFHLLQLWLVLLGLRFYSIFFLIHEGQNNFITRDEIFIIDNDQTQEVANVHIERIVF